MMKTIRLLRVEESKEHGTFGVLFIDKVEFCRTVEPADRDNKVGVSSIPCGWYRCVPYSSEKYPNVYQVMDVPNRTNILFHKGNIDDNTEGCIILGAYRGKLGKDRAVLNSGNTFKRFRNIIGKEEFNLEVRKWCW